MVEACIAGHLVQQPRDRADGRSAPFTWRHIPRLACAAGLHVPGASRSDGHHARWTLAAD